MQLLRELLGWGRGGGQDYDDEEFDPTVQPKSGGSYTLWPVVHSELTDYGLKSITPDEVRGGVAAVWLQRGQGSGTEAVNVCDLRGGMPMHARGAHGHPPTTVLLSPP